MKSHIREPWRRLWNSAPTDIAFCSTADVEAIG